MASTAVSIVIPTRNRLSLLSEAVESVRRQSGDWELIVVVDASRDGTVEWLRKLPDPRVRMVELMTHNERSAARNRGLAEARAPYVLFLDDDDRLAPDALTMLATSLGEIPEAVAAVGAVVAFDQRGQRRRLPHPRRRRVRDVLMEVMFGWPVPPGSTMFRTAVVRGIGGWPVGLSQGEDQDLWLRVATRGPVVLVPHLALEHRRHRGQQWPTDALETERALREAFNATLQGDMAGRGARALRARLLFEEGLRDWRSNDRRMAFRRFLKAARVAPELLRSPIAGARLRSMLLRTAVGSAIGRRSTAAAQRLVWTARRALHRAPGEGPQLLPRRRAPRGEVRP